MAKKKIVDPEVEETMVEQPENAEEALADNNAPEVTETPKEEPEEKPKKTKTSKVIQDISENVKDVLKVFNQYPELLVTSKGGVFMPGTKLPQSEGAILYKNPYYNS